jgi:pyridoxal phosphate enzyme (YggS family)
MIGLALAAEALRARIRDTCLRCGRDPSTVRLLAVTKTHPADTVLAAMDAGLTDFGENYAQELVAKAAAVTSAGRRPNWHFIGGLQTNKVRSVMPVVASVHSVDRPSLIDELGRRSSPDAPLPVFVEVNVGGEDQKSGASPGDVTELCRRILGVPSLHLSGLMAVPPITGEPEDSRPYFRGLRELRDGIVSGLGGPAGILGHLSMGMSHDFEVAIEEGATWVRVGTALFGYRSHAR